MKHILLHNLFSLEKRNSITPPSNFSYNKEVGAWIDCQNGSLLMLHSSFAQVGTKKFDVETGEDHKGK
jgi:hypothetical protein